MTQEMNVTQKAALFLMEKACQRETTYYEALAQHCGLPTQGNALSMACSKLLTDVFEWCQRKGLPPLTALVVRKSGQDAGCHGLGFWKIIDGTDVLARCGIDVSEAPLNATERVMVGKFLIVKVWNYFADLRPFSNVEMVGKSLSDDRRAYTPGSVHHNQDLTEIFKILESIPGWELLSEHKQELLRRGQTVISVEIIQDRIHELLKTMDVRSAWLEVLKQS